MAPQKYIEIVSHMYFTGHMYLTLKWKTYIKRWCLQFLIYQRNIELQL